LVLHGSKEKNLEKDLADIPKDLIKNTLEKKVEVKDNEKRY
tara:strand:+ start:1159 stop:1281 length:123 start_codon:yes stop_codon:yes gene_type:complete